MGKPEQLNTNFDYLKDSAVLVTGGTGSIGSRIVAKALDAGARYVRVLSRNQGNQINLLDMLYEHQHKIDLVSGSIEDRDVVEDVMHGIDYVYHAAAGKYVPECEKAPMLASNINIQGSDNVFSAARRTPGIKKVVAISTDKAIEPYSVMGASKMMMERLVIHHAERVRIAGEGPAICVVRFGNVTASRGSVMPYFVRQIASGGPVTITHPEMARFMMTIPDAVNLVLSAATDAQGGEIYVLKMGAMKITDLARIMIREIAPLFDKNSDDIEMKIVGPRPGEKFHESLITSEELRRTIDFGAMYKIYPEGQLPENAVTDGDFAVSTEDADMMTDDEIIVLLNRINYLDKDQVRHVVRRRVITP